MEPSKTPCSKKTECDDLQQERIHYFMGRHLTARDFCDEQAYHRTHRLFHNRILHGWGIVCGLEVKQHGTNACQNRYVEVTPGIALDCCGRELVVDGPVSCSEQGLPEIPWKEFKETHPLLLLCLSYQQKDIDQVPVLYNEGDCSETITKYGRHKDGWKLCWRWIASSDLPKYHWDPLYSACPPRGHSDQQQAQSPQGAATPGQSTDAASEVTEREATSNPMIHPSPPCPKDDCGDPCSEEYKSCIVPSCTPDHCVPLAVICAIPNEPVVNEMILLKGRPELLHVPRRLTHIVNINWPHGGVISPSWLHHHKKFVVTFDRKLKRPEHRTHPGPWGVNKATFVVQYGEQYEDLDFVIYDEPPALADSLCEAEYTISPRKNDDTDYEYLVGHMLWITLKCDFLYDCHGMRVDGNNDGIAGGTFESWVSVVSDYNYEQMKKDGKL